MATDHRGRDVHAGKRTSDQIRIRVNPMKAVIQDIWDEVGGEAAEGTDWRPTRQEHNDMFTAPGDSTPHYEYPYPPKYRVTPTKAINPPPKRRNSVPKTKEAPTEEQRANRDVFW